MVELCGLVRRGRWAADLVVATAAGAFLGLVGPFGTFFGVLWQRVVYWTAMSWVGFALFAFVGRPLLARLGPRRGPAWAWVAVYAVAISAPLGLASSLAAAVIWPGARHYGGFATPVWYLESLTITAGYVALFAALGGYRFETAPALPSPSPNLLGVSAGAVLCLQMEDHYVRVHTAQGSRLVLATMAQAVAAVGKAPGLRVHRSWWVADKAVAGVQADGRNLRLALAAGLTAPVARSSVAAVRAAGWLARGGGGAAAGR